MTDSLAQTAQLAKDARARLGLSQDEFGKLIGAAKKTVANWEGGHKPPLGPAYLLLRLIVEGVIDARHLRRVAIPA